MGSQLSDGSPAFAADDIRPVSLMNEQARLYAEDVARLVRHHADFVAVPCPACDADAAVPQFQKMGIDYVACERCRTMYVSPRPRPSHLAEYYRTSRNYEYWAEHIFPASEQVRRERIFRPRVQRILELCEQYRLHRGTLVEIGPGFGTFCQELQDQRAFESVIAIEPTPALAAACRARGVQVIESPVEEIDLAALGAVDVVASFEVIEHLFDPSAFLRAIYRILQPGGLVVLSCPNGLGFEVQQLGPMSTTVDSEHLNYFNPASLRTLLEAVHFDVLETTTPGRLDADLVRSAVLKGDLSVEDDPLLTRVLVEEWDELGGPFQAFLAHHGLSSHLWAVARRPA